MIPISLPRSFPLQDPTPIPKVEPHPFLNTESLLTDRLRYIESMEPDHFARLWEENREFRLQNPRLLAVLGDLNSYLLGPNPQTEQAVARSVQGWLESGQQSWLTKGPLEVNGLVYLNMKSAIRKLQLFSSKPAEINLAKALEPLFFTPAPVEKAPSPPVEKKPPEVLDTDPSGEFGSPSRKARRGMRSTNRIRGIVYRRTMLGLEPAFNQRAFRLWERIPEPKNLEINFGERPRDRLERKELRLFNRMTRVMWRRASLGLVPINGRVARLLERLERAQGEVPWR